MTAAEGRELQVCPTCQAIFRTGYRACPHDGTRLMNTTTDPLIGHELAGRYLVEKLLGDGGLGRVYRARHARMSRRYALKVLYGDVAYDPKVRTRFANEAEAASRLSHPNVVGVVDFGETEAGLLYIAMDLAEGRSLADVIAERGRLPAYHALRLFREITLGLAHAHERGLIHRDLKPENIIIEKKGGQPRIVDFGLALLQEQPTSRVTTGGMVIGTPHYMAPEQATGEAIDQRTDLFSLGLVLYEMIAGVLPFEGPALEVARMNLTVTPPSFAQRVPGLQVEGGLEKLCMQLLAKRPRDRPESAQAVLAMIDRLGPQGATGRMDQKLTWIDDDDGIDRRSITADPLGDTADPSDELQLGEDLPPEPDADVGRARTSLSPARAAQPTMRASPRSGRDALDPADDPPVPPRRAAAEAPRRAGLTEPPPLPAVAERLGSDDGRGPLSTHELVAAVNPRRRWMVAGIGAAVVAAIVVFVLVRNPDGPARGTAGANAGGADGGTVAMAIDGDGGPSGLAAAGDGDGGVGVGADVADGGAAAEDGDAGAVAMALDAGVAPTDASTARVPTDAAARAPTDAAARTPTDARPRDLIVDASVMSTPIDAGVRRPPVDAAAPRAPIDAPAAPAAITATAIKAAYRKAGESIDALERAGKPDAARLRKRWADLPLADALARPELRAEFLDRIRDLQAAIAAVD